MKKMFVFVLVVVTLVATSCVRSATSADTGEQFRLAAENYAATQAATPVASEQEEAQVPTPEATAVPPTAEPAVVVSNSLVNPELFDADTQPVGDGEGYFDIGVNPGQLGIVFGWDLSWGENLIEGEGCEIVVLSNGWYEDFRIVDGRYEIYTVPSTDIDGWTQVLIDQRIAEQAEHYGCSADVIPPVWDGK